MIGGGTGRLGGARLAALVVEQRDPCPHGQQHRMVGSVGTLEGGTRLVEKGVGGLTPGEVRSLAQDVAQPVDREGQLLFGKRLDACHPDGAPVVTSRLLEVAEI